MQGEAAGEHLYHFSIPATGQHTISFDACASTLAAALRVKTLDLSEEFYFGEDAPGADCNDPDREPTVTFSDLRSGEYALVIEGRGEAEGEYEVFMNCSSVPAFCHESCNQPNHPDAAPEHRCFKLALECDGDLDSLLPCDAEELVVGERCEGDGECGTMSDADNCPGGFDVYNFTHRPVVAAPAQTSIPTPGQASTPASATRPTPIPTSAPTPPDQQTQPTPCGGTIQGSTTNANAVPGKPYEL